MHWNLYRYVAYYYQYLGEDDERYFTVAFDLSDNFSSTSTDTMYPLSAGEIAMYIKPCLLSYV